AILRKGHRRKHSHVGRGAHSIQAANDCCGGIWRLRWSLPRRNYSHQRRSQNITEEYKTQQIHSLAHEPSTTNQSCPGSFIIEISLCHRGFQSANSSVPPLPL